MNPGSDNLKTTFGSGQMYDQIGQLINARHRHMNAVSGEQSGGHTASLHTGLLRAKARFAPTLLDIAKVTNAADTCGVTTDVGESVASPCESQGLYVRKSRFYDSLEKRWQEYDENVDLDTTAYFTDDPNDAVKSPVTDHATRQQAEYSIGDVVPTVWDELRNKSIPLQDVPQDVSHSEWIANAQAVAQVGESAGEIGDDWAAVFLEIWRPVDSDWQTMSSLNWQTPHCESSRFSRDSRSNFALFNAPHGTLVRLRAVASSTGTQVLHRVQMRLYGAGRNSQRDFVPYEAPQTEGGDAVINWQLRAHTENVFKDQVTVLQGHIADKSIFEVTYADPLDAWQIGCSFSAVLENIATPRNSKTLDIITDITCKPDQDPFIVWKVSILEWCKRTITFPPEIADCITIGDEECFTCDEISETSSSSSVSSSSLSSSSLSSSSLSSSSTQTATECCALNGECTWTWTVPDDPEIGPDPFWELLDTCTAACTPTECQCINPPTRDGDFPDEIWPDALCVPI